MSDCQENIVAAALSLVGTPFHHAAALKGIGCDCVGVLIYTAKAVGLIAHDWRPAVYSREWHIHKNQQLLQETMESLGFAPVPLGERQPGHVLVFQFGRVLSHAGILVSATPETLVHSIINLGVRHHGLTGDLLSRLRAVYTFPEVRA